ncbi:MAG TPA: hypothetical protein VNT81_01980, partial [Vicinamibacterales bacterium]|nr:hypothetical protein [Vicinamibacterales bacterium]
QREQGSTLSDATAIRGDAAVLPPALEESGLSMTFAIAAIGADVVVRVEVEEVRVPGVEDPGTSLASVA